MPLDDALKVRGGGSLAAVRLVKVLHHRGEGVLPHGAEIEHHVSQHLEHPGALVVRHEGVVPGVQLLGARSDPDGRRIVAPRADLPAPVLDMLEELRVVL